MNFTTYVKTAFRWQRGRQNTGYDKLLILTGKYPLAFDIYLLKFPPGSEIPMHTDTVTHGNHFRMNIVLKKAKSGGDFICSNVLWENSRIKLFRPDIASHRVTRIQKGTRYVLSIGWIRLP